MASRFERLFQLPENQYAEGAPIILSAGVLSKDNDSGNILVQLKFHSVSPKHIKAVKVSLSAYDVSHDEIEGVTDYQYLDLDITNGIAFGSNKAIIFPNHIARSFSITSLRVIFDDDSLWEYTHNFMPLPQAVLLSTVLADPELLKQYTLSTNDRAYFSPTESSGLWLCPCGCWNSADTCTSCHLDKATAFSSLDNDFLTENMNLRFEQERRRQEEYEKHLAELHAIEEEKRIHRQKQIKKYSIIAAAVFLVICICCGIYAKIKELTIDKLLACYTKTDVVSLVGVDEDSDDIYDVRYFGKKFILQADYDGDTLISLELIYDFPAVRKADSSFDIDEYEPSENEIANVDAFKQKIMDSYTEKYGEAEYGKSEYDVISHAWVVHDRKIEVCYPEDNDAPEVGAFIIFINCDHQSFCEHSDTTFTHADATCTEDGFDCTICNTCGFVDEKILDAFGHSNSVTVKKEPTCFEEGIEVHTCSVCDNVDEVPIESLTHIYVETVTTEATCTTDGTLSYTCSLCEDTYTETIFSYGHDWVDATCESAKHCVNCGQTEGSALGHNWVVSDSEEPTCTYDGFISYYCERCSGKYTETIAAYGHDMQVSYGWDSTCTSQGEIGYECSRCEYFYWETLPLLPHNVVDGSCTMCWMPEDWL